MGGQGLDAKTPRRRGIERRILPALLLAGCAPQKPKIALPAEIAGWRLKATRELPPSAGAVRVIEGYYEGKGEVTVDLYQMKSSAAALDAVQKWRPSADTVFFYKDVYFVLVKWRSADRGALQEFIRALEGKI